MVLHFGSFTRRRLLVNRMLPEKHVGGGINHGESGGCNTRKEMENTSTFIISHPLGQF